MKNKQDPFEIIDKIIVFVDNFADSNNSNWGIDCPIGFKAKVISISYEHFTKERIEFKLDFSEFLEENLKLLEPGWKDIIDGKEIDNLKWNECPSFWPKENIVTYYCCDIFDLPFISLD